MPSRRRSGGHAWRVARALAMGAALTAHGLAQAQPASNETLARTQVSLETGLEVDSNPARRAQVTGDPAPVTVPAAWLGARLRQPGQVGRTRVALGLEGLARTALDRGQPAEDVTTLRADASASRLVGDDSTASLGVRGYDVIALSDPTSQRTFRALTVDLGLSVPLTPGASLRLSASATDLRYKPAPDLSWRGGSLGARASTRRSMGGPDGGGDGDEDEDAPSWTATVGTRMEIRDYQGVALFNICAPGADPDPRCLAPSNLGRADRHLFADVELGYAGAVIASARYQLLYVSSNSHGQALRRHRLDASITAERFGLLATVSALVQLDRYPDGQLLAADNAALPFLSIDDDPYSSVQVRLARPLSARWGAELRAGVWRDLSADADRRFARELAYLGLTWQR